MVDDTPRGMPDRRKHPRLSAKIDIRFRAVADAQRALKAYSVNLSMGGLCIRSQRAHEVGEQLRLSITIENQEFELSGVVAWARNGAIGVRFIDVSDEDKLRLRRTFDRLRF